MGIYPERNTSTKYPRSYLVIFINDLPDVISNSAKSFDDDMKLFRTVLAIEDHHVIQQDLDNLVKWAYSWHLGFP